MKSPIKYPGGKSKLWQKIIPHFPEHKIYVEPFLGGGSILLNKVPAEETFASDINEPLIKMWQCIKSYPSILVGNLKTLKYASHTLKYYKFKPHLMEHEFVIRNMSRGGEGITYAWSERSRGGMGGDENAWNNAIKAIDPISNLIQDVTFICNPAIHVINETDFDHTFFYEDPPYLHSTRVSKALYTTNEISKKDHEELATVNNQLEGKVCISGYRSTEYDLWYKDWRRVDIPTTTQALFNRQERVECIWMNY